MVAVQVIGVLVVFAIAGAGCGWLWHRLWDPPIGVVVRHTWNYAQEADLGTDFGGTGLYVLIAVLAGLLLGIVTALLCARAEVATLLAVVAGSALAAWLMWAVGVHLSAADPRALAKTAPEGTRLPGNLHLSRHSPFAAFPVGALIGLAAVFLGVSRRERSAR